MLFLGFCRDIHCGAVSAGHRRRRWYRALTFYCGGPVFWHGAFTVDCHPQCHKQSCSCGRSCCRRGRGTCVGLAGHFHNPAGAGSCIAWNVHFLEESLPSDRRFPGKLMASANGYRQVLGVRGFASYSISYAMSMAALFAYISATPFIVQDIFGFSEVQFSLVFAINAIALAFGSALSLRFRNMANAAFYGSALGALLALAGTLLYLSGVHAFLAYEIPTFVMLFCIGLVLTGTTSRGNEPWTQSCRSGIGCDRRNRLHIRGTCLSIGGIRRDIPHLVCIVYHFYVGLGNNHLFN